MMSRIALVLVIALLPLATNTAPSDSKEQKSLQPESTQLESTDEKSEQTRQKRWYNYFGYGFTPMNGNIYSNYDSYKSSFDAPDEPFEEIYRRLLEISTFLRRPSAPPQFPFHPVLYPVIYVPAPAPECNCQVPDAPNVPQVQPGQDQPSNGSLPEIGNRVNGDDGSLDPNRIWGLDYGNPMNDADDPNRPVSFATIPPPNRPLTRPPPPVEHGSQQAGAGPSSSGPPPPSPPANQGANIPPANLGPINVPGISSNAPPTACDGAILTCCHQTVITYECFADEGCSDLSAYGNQNPCERETMLKVIDRFKRFCGQNSV